jgi:methionyl-tRNA formyltransferase
MSEIKLGFATSVKLGLSCMKSIYDTGNKLSLVITLPNNIAIKKAGRVFLDDFCEQHQISLIKSSNINNYDVINEIKKKKIDWLFIIGWSQIVNTEILSAPNKGVIGAHPTLLPFGRGRASIPWAILKKLDRTGVTLFKIDNGVDTGPILSQRIINLEINENATDLYSKVETAHALIIQDFLPLLLSDNFALIPQNETLATVWPSRKPEDGEIDLAGSVWSAERLVRAVTKPYPGAFYFKNKKKIIIWKAYVLDKEPQNKKFLKFKDGFLILEVYEIEK